MITALNEYCKVGDNNYSDDRNWIDRFISWNKDDLILDEIDGVYIENLNIDISNQHYVNISWICRSIER